ncbi:Uncharacterized protein APZ42_028608 [Daphnia magna]|uniref:Uncharacterized protein n=1 Tax=Daphnia magna TaxID=35525 RepID=A0A164Q629_9CRUS|nr:Uncharacterized protein APZ42_028608 [Daphnia magna]
MDFSVLSTQFNTKKVPLDKMMKNGEQLKNGFLGFLLQILSAELGIISHDLKDFRCLKCIAR